MVIKLMASLCRSSWPELFRITCLEVLFKHIALKQGWEWSRLLIYSC